MLRKNLHDRMASLYGTLSFLFGCRNYYYDRKLHCYRIDHWPTLIYSLLVNAAIAVGLPVLVITVLKSFHSCTLPTLVYYITWLTSYVLLGEVYLNIAVQWLRRRQLCNLSNRLTKLMSIFDYEAAVSDGMRRVLHRSEHMILGGTVVTCVVYIQSVYWLYQSNAQGCDNAPETLEINHLINLLFSLLLYANKLMADFKVYSGLVHGEMLLSGCLQEMAQLLQEVRTLSDTERQMPRIPSWHGIHWLQLQKHCARILRRQRLTKDYLWEFMHYQRYQVLATLLRGFLETIALGFDVVLAMSAAENAISSGFYAILLIWLGMRFSYFLMVFYVCDRIQGVFDQTSQTASEIRQELGAAQEIRCKARRKITKMLEMFTLEMKHTRFTLKICGFFDLTMATAADMIEGVFANLLILVQYAFLDIRNEMLTKQLTEE